MSDTDCMERISIVVTIVNQGYGKIAAQMYKSQHSHMVFQYICHASGTASSDLLDYLGLEQTQKDMVISLIPLSRIQGLLENINERMQLDKPGKGIAFTLRLSSLSSYVCQQIGEREDKKEEGVGHIMQKDAKYELILAVVNHGFADKAMSAAKDKGAQGGTVIEARLLETEEASRFLGISIKEEKEIVAIVAHREAKMEIMQAINHEAGVRTEGRGILMSLPVDTLMGLGDLHKI